MNQPDNPQILSRLLDQWRTSSSPEVEAVVDEFITELKAQEQRVRARKKADEARLRVTLQAVLLDLYAAFRTNPERHLRVSLRKEDYATKSRYTNPDLTYQPVKDVVEFLWLMNYVDFRIGFYDRATGNGRRSTMRATDKLISVFKEHGVTLGMIVTSPDIELVRLKDTEKLLTDYTDTEETETIRANLNRINQLISDCDIRLSMPERDIVTMQQRHLDKQTGRLNTRRNPDSLPDIDFTRTVLRRVFNNDSFAQGGRFYGGWWQVMPKRHRNHIIIDGEETLELDYSALHPRMLYHLEGIDLPSGDDAYSLPGFEARHRKIIKRTFQRLLNAKQRQGMTLEPEEAFSLPEGKTFNHLIDSLLDKHKAIGRHFFTGDGLQLQRIDSDIAEAVQLRLADLNIPTLPVHDSFIVPSSSGKALRDAMADCYHGKLGYWPEVD